MNYSNLRSEYLKENNIDNTISDEELEKIIMIKNAYNLKYLAYNVQYLKSIMKIVVLLSGLSFVLSIIGLSIGN